MPQTGPTIIEPPFGLLCLSASLKKENIDAVILDTRFDNYKKMFENGKDDILAVGLTVMTGPQISHAIKISRFVNIKSDIPVIWGGIHPTLLPEQTLEEKSIDYIVEGYGETALPALLKTIAEKKEPQGLPNIAYRHSGSVIINPRDEGGFEVPLKYDWDAINVERYLQTNYKFGHKVLSLFTSNGCPHNCTFCYGKEFHSKKWRAQSVSDVLADIDKLKTRSSFDSVYFHDDNFFADRARALEIAKGMKARGLPFGMSIRADYSDEGLIRSLKEYGCAQVDWGTESGSQRILDLYKKGITLADIERTAKLTSKYGINAYTTVIMGHPEETNDELVMTMELVDRIMAINPGLSVSDIKILTPYPGSEIYADAVAKGRPLPRSLEEWGRYFWNNSNALTVENRKFLDIITIVSLLAFCEWRIRKKNPVYNAILGLLHRISVLRWKKKYFKHPYEIYLCRAAINIINRFIV